MNYFVNALAIRRWADRIDARALLPQVIRRLAGATVTTITEIDFPAHESVQRAGFDGTIVCKKGNPWVPSGKSVWELSVGQGIKGKADRDFSKRTGETPREVQENSTYIFATPRHWKSKDDWIADQVDKGHWKEVRAYDSDDLEQWFETAAPVAVWFGGLIGARPSGVDDLAARWNALSESAMQKLLPSLFLKGHEKTVEKLREWLASPPSWLAIASRSPVEVIDFICAWAASLDENERTALESRAILVEDVGSWKQLRETQTPAILAVDPSIALSTDEIARAVANGHHVLLSVEPVNDVGSRAVEFERARQAELTQGLEECGYSPAEAEQLARASGGSLAVLKNRLASPRFSMKPFWADTAPHDVITATLLLGGWDGRNAADQAAFEKIAGRPYDACETDLQKLATCRDPLVLHAANHWRLISKDEGWTIFGNLVSPSALRNFESLALEILADDDPRYNLPESQRPYAAIEGHVPKYSGTIKKHVAETLALLGALRDSLEASASVNIQAAVDRIVASVLSPTATWHRWASLGSRVPLLAEASPRAFLKAVKDDLANSESELLKLFNDDGDLIFSRCNHAGLLWALEGLAWSELYLGEVATILLTLSDKDPGGKWANRPHNTLGQILSYWMPYTTANCDVRIKVLDLLIDQDPKAAWPILFKFLPSMESRFSTPTHKPYWRDWANAWTRGATYADSRRFIVAASERIIAHAKTDAARWVMVINNVENVPEEVRPQLIESLRALAATDLSDGERRIMAEELSDQIHAHRRFQDARWSFPPAILDELDEVLADLTPHGEVMKNVWLFKKWPEQFIDREISHDANQVALADARSQAIADIIVPHGFGGILELLQHVESTCDLGHSVAVATKDEFLDQIIPAMLGAGEREREFAAGFIWNRVHAEKWPWIDRTLALCSTPSSKAWLLCAPRFCAEAWQRASTVGEEVSQLYWERCRAFNPELETADVETAVRELVKHGRPIFAVDLLTMALHKERPVSTDCLVLCLEAVRSRAKDEDLREMGQRIRYGVPDVIEALQQREDADEGTLLALEFSFLQLLDDHSGHEPRTLFKRLNTHPEFFVELLSYCYRSRNEDVAAREEAEAGKLNAGLATQIYDLLHEWKRVPGTNEQGEVDETALRSWLNEARQLAENVGRLEICDNYIGQVLATAPPDTDGTWPCRAVRQVAAEIGTESLESGLRCAIYNSRGVVWRGSGGEQERELATKYEGYADSIRFENPFVAKVLSDVAQHYEREARGWDERDRWEER